MNICQCNTSPFYKNEYSNAHLPQCYIFCAQTDISFLRLKTRIYKQQAMYLFFHGF